MKKLLPSLLLVAAAPAVAVEENPFVTHTELGYVNTSGNTETESFALDFMAKKAWDKQSLQFDLNALYGTERKVESKNRYVTVLSYDYLFAKHFSVNLLGNYKEDKFSGYDYQWFLGPGLKYTALKGKEHNLSFQLNAVYSSDKEMDRYYNDNSLTTEVPHPYVGGKSGLYKVDAPETSYYGGTLAKLEYSWQITEAVKFIQTADYRGDWEDADKYFIVSKTALESKMSELLSMGLSYKVDYANEPPAGVEHADKVFMVSLIVDY